MKWWCFCLRSNTCWCPHVSNHFAAPNTNVWWDHNTRHLHFAFEVVAVAVGEAAIHCVYRPGIIPGFNEYQKMPYAIICIQTEWRCDNGNMCYHNHRNIATTIPATPSLCCVCFDNCAMVMVTMLWEYLWTSRRHLIHSATRYLLYKLDRYGIRGHANSFFRSNLTNRGQFTIVNGVESELKNTSCGVP